MYIYNSHTMVKNLKEGNTDAFRQLFRQYYPSVLAFVTGFVKDPELSEDIAQEVFMKVWIYRSSLEPSKPIRNYLYLLARRHICSHFRKTVTLQKYISDISTEELEELISIYDNTDAVELQRIAEEIVGSMPEKRRLVFTLSRGEGMTVDEIADRLGVSVRTVEKHIQLALRTLRSKLRNL